MFYLPLPAFVGPVLSQCAALCWLLPVIIRSVYYCHFRYSSVGIHHLLIIGCSLNNFLSSAVCLISLETCPSHHVFPLCILLLLENYFTISASPVNSTACCILPFLFSFFFLRAVEVLGLLQASFSSPALCLALPLYNYETTTSAVQLQNHLLSTGARGGGSHRYPLSLTRAPGGASLPHNIRVPRGAYGRRGVAGGSLPLIVSHYPSPTGTVSRGLQTSSILSFTAILGSAPPFPSRSPTVGCVRRSSIPGIRGVLEGVRKREGGTTGGSKSR